MSRRPNPAADRAEQNRATLKSLVKLESNKTCADCKKNKQPRWASWNLGIFICIRCSGIHRGMGTHISRVKSVDLDSWTDEQLQSMLRWGNSRANKYWEAKLAPGHVPAEAKIENFIRTKYESKRWVMDGPMPDPATLDAEGDDDVPLNVVQEKAKLERSASQRAAASSPQSKPPPPKPQQNIDLFGDDTEPAPPRPSTTGPSIGRSVPPKAEAAPPKQTKPGDSLLGLDFFGAPSSTPPARPSSTTGTSSAAPSRPDLKQSILSLYANTAPRPAAAPPAQHGRTDSFGGLSSPGLQTQQAPSSSGFGGLNDAFSGLSFSSQPAQQAPKPSAFADLAGFSSPRATSQASTTASSTFGGGGSFFDTIPKSSKPNSPPPQQAKPFSPTGSFGSLGSPTAAAPAPAASKPAPSSGMGDLFDLSMPASQPSQAPKPMSPQASSVFNLSSPPLSSNQPAAQPKAQPAAVPNYSSGFSNLDAWGSNDAWASTSTSQQPAATSTSTHDDFGGWASSTSTAQKVTSPKVSADEDFGGWSSATTSQPATTSAPKPLGGLGGDDLFSNVWE